MEFCFPSHKKHLLDVYHPDIFVCSDEQGKRISELYDPIGMEIHSQDKINSVIGDLSNYTNCQTQPAKDLSYNWKLLRCGEMLREHEQKFGKYDIVMLTRFDVKFVRICRIDIPDPKTIYIPHLDALLTPADNMGWHFGGYSGQLCWCSSDTASIIMNYFDECPTLYRQLGYWQAEVFFKKLCDNHGIVPKLEDIYMMIIRGTNSNPLSTDLKPLEKFLDFCQ